MRDMHKEYPYYKWDSNKGYGTKDHLNAIQQFGFSRYHRKSFKVKI